jgi:hypothetical protein
VVKAVGRVTPVQRPAARGARRALRGWPTLAPHAWRRIAVNAHGDCPDGAAATADDPAAGGAWLGHAKSGSEPLRKKPHNLGAAATGRPHLAALVRRAGEGNAWGCGRPASASGARSPNGAVWRLCRISMATEPPRASSRLAAQTREKSVTRASLVEPSLLPSALR